MAINSFHTLFDARERKFQTEKIFQGEDVDLVAAITNDGVPQDLTGYTVTGYYQPTDYPGTDNASLFYSVNAEISQDKKSVIVHWTYDKDFGKTGYIVWALLTKDSEHSYPVAWKINLAHSPGYPAGETPEPIPQTIDFNDYTLLNAPWLPLAGGTCTGDVTVNATLTANKVTTPDLKVNADKGSTQVFIGSNAGSNMQTGGGVAIGYNSKTNGMGVAIGTASDVGTIGTAAVGFLSKATGMQAVSLGNDIEATGAVSIAMGAGSKATNVGSMAFGYSSYAQAANAIQIGTYTADYGEGSIGTTPCYNTTPNSVQFFQHQVFQTTGNPTSNPSTSNLVLVRERAPWAVSFTDAAMQWVDETPYTAGSFVTYNNKFYYCFESVYSVDNPATDTEHWREETIGGALMLKADTAALEDYAPLASPTFTGTPTAPTATTGTNTTQVATTAFVNASITATVGDINSALDTILGEVI